MSGDDDKPPRRRHQSHTERDLDGLRARRERANRDQVGELGDALDDGDGTVTGPIAWDDVTKPHDVPDIGDIVLERYNNDPAYRALWHRVDDARRDQRRSKRATDDRILEAVGSKPPNERLTQVETRMKIMWAIVAAVGTLAGGAAVTVAKGLYERGETDGQHEIRLQQVEKMTVRIEMRLDQIERYFFPVDEVRRLLTPPKGP